MSQGSRKRILLVEDEAIIALGEKLQLEDYGYEVSLADSGEKAVEAVRRGPGIDLILMDINLGRGMDGTEAAEAILRERELPIVFLSSHVEREVVEKTERITSYGYVVKNSTITVLDASIKMAFKLFEARLNEARATQTARESERKHRQITENIKEVLWLASADRAVIEYINPAYERVWGRSCGSLYDDPRSFMDAIHPDDKEAVADRYREYRQGRGFDLEYRIVRPDGEIRWVRAETFPVLDESGAIRGEAGIALDLTEQKAAMDEIRRHQKMLDEIIRISRIAGSSLELNTVLNKILEQAVRAQTASAGMIFLRDPHTGNLTWGAALGLSAAFVKEFQDKPIRPGEGLTGRIALEKKPIYIAENSSGDKRVTRSVINQEACTPS